MGSKARRTFSALFTLDAVLEVLTGHKTVAHICHERTSTDTLLYDGKRAFRERAASIFETGPAATREAQARIADVERMVGRRVMENEIQKRLACSRRPAGTEASDA